MCPLVLATLVLAAGAGCADDGSAATTAAESSVDMGSNASGDTSTESDLGASTDAEASADRVDTSAASVDATPDGDAQADSPPEPNLIRFVHAAPGFAPLDFYFAEVSSPLWQGISYGHVSDWLELDTELVNVSAQVFADMGASAQPHLVFEDDLTLPANGLTITAIALSEQSNDAPDTLRVVLFRHEDPPPFDMTHLVMINGIDVVLNLGVDLEDDAVGPAGLEVSALAPYEAAQPIEADSEPFSLGIWTGTEPEKLSTIGLPSLGPGLNFVILTLVEGRLEALIVDEQPDPEGDTSRQLRTGREHPRVWLVHALPSTPDTLDVFVDDREDALWTALNFGDVTELTTQLAPGNHELAFHVAGSDRNPSSDPLAVGAIEVDPGHDYLVLLNGFDPLALRALNELPVVDLLHIELPPPGRASLGEEYSGADAGLRFVHIAPPITIDGGLLSGPEPTALDEDALWFEELAPNSVSEWCQLPTGRVEFGLRAHGDKEELLGAFAINAEPSSRHLLIGVGPYLERNQTEVFGLIDVVLDRWTASLLMDFGR